VATTAALGRLFARAHVRTREVDSASAFSDHFVMAVLPRCAALLRNGQPCSRTVAEGTEFCVHHAGLLATVDAETLRQGRTPKDRARATQMLRIVSTPDAETTVDTTSTNADPATVRPSLAAAAAENVEQLTASLLEAAGSAVKPVWLTVECAACGERARIEAPIPDVRARVAAIELLLREGLGRPATAEELPSPRLPASVGAVKEMGWAEMQTLFAMTYVDEIEAVERSGGEAALRANLASLSDAERQALRNALDELQPV
jgi:hypothetical protein